MRRMMDDAHTTGTPTSARRIAACMLGAVLISAAIAAQGCTGYTPGGPQYSMERFTYESVPSMPQSVNLVDTRTGEVVWAMDIPVGQRLTIRFKDDQKKSTRLGYDEMVWGLHAIGAPGRTLPNSMRVPPSYARRLDGFVREPEFGPAPAARGSVPSAAPTGVEPAPTTDAAAAPAVPDGPPAVDLPN